MGRDPQSHLPKVYLSQTCVQWACREVLSDYWEGLPDYLLPTSPKNLVPSKGGEITGSSELAASTQRACTMLCSPALVI